MPTIGFAMARQIVQNLIGLSLAINIKHILINMNACQKQNEKTFVKMFQNGKYVLWKC